jgi:hypothetical protein
MTDVKIEPPKIARYILVSNGTMWGVASAEGSFICTRDSKEEAIALRDKWNAEQIAKTGDWKVAE